MNLAAAPTPEDVIARLDSNAARIADLTASLTPAQLQTRPSPGEWSAVELLGHLRACGDVWGGCMRRLGEEDRPTFAAVSPRTWIKRTDYLSLGWEESFEAFRVQRAELVGFLGSLSSGDWERVGFVTAYGRVLERTVYFYAEWLARHERGHLRQFSKIAAEVRGS